MNNKRSIVRRVIVFLIMLSLCAALTFMTLVASLAQ